MKLMQNQNILSTQLNCDAYWQIFINLSIYFSDFNYYYYFYPPNPLFFTLFCV